MQVGRGSLALELEGIGATPQVVAAVRKESYTCSSECSTHGFGGPMESRLDSTTRGMIDHCDLQDSAFGVPPLITAATHPFITRSYLRPGANEGIGSSKTPGQAQPRYCSSSLAACLWASKPSRLNNGTSVGELAERTASAHSWIVTIYGCR